MCNFGNGNRKLTLANTRKQGTAVFRAAGEEVATGARSNLRQLEMQQQRERELT